MTAIVTRSGKGSALLWTEVDTNFTNLNTDKAEKSVVDLKAPLDSPTFTGTVSGISATDVTLEPTGSLSSTNTQAGIAELESEKAALTGANFSGNVSIPKTQMGVSATASENHFWDGSVANKLTLKRGTPDAPGAIVFEADAGQVLLPNQKIPAYSAMWTGSVGTSNGSVLLQTTEELDTDNAYSGGRFTPQVAGWYQVNASMQFLAATTMTYAALLIKKNATTVATSTNGPFATYYAAPSVGRLVYLNGTTDYIEIWQDINVTGAATITSGSTSACLVRRG